MIDWLIRRRLAAFEAQWHYSMDYARQLLASNRRAFWGYAKLAPLAQYREGVPAAAWHVAKIAALRHEDCGPCSQLAVDIARAEGVPDALLRAALADDMKTLQQLNPDAALAHAFALAWTRREASLSVHRESLRQRIGDKGLSSLALAMSAARMFPMIKTALGHGEACLRIQLGDESAMLAVPDAGNASLSHERRVHDMAATMPHRMAPTAAASTIRT